jgi:hypothetical protein
MFEKLTFLVYLFAPSLAQEKLLSAIKLPFPIDSEIHILSSLFNFQTTCKHFWKYKSKRMGQKMSNFFLEYNF